MNKQTLIYTNLKAVITGSGFAKKNGRKVSAEDLNVIEGPAHIVCENGIIKKVVREGSKELFANSKQVNCKDLVATAAFVDSHTHALFAGARWQEFFARWAGASYASINKAGGGIRQTFRDTAQATDAALMQSLGERLDAMYAQGVRLVEVKTGYGATPDEELRLLRLLKKFSSRKNALEIKKTFLALHAVPKDISEKDWTDKMIGLLDIVRDDELAEFVDAFPEKGFFSLSETERFFRAAQEAGLDLRVHADEITDMGASQLGIQLAALSIDHLQKISEESIKALKSSGTVATLLPATSFFMGIDYAPARKIIDAGARVALATDFNPGTAPDPSLLFTAKLAASQMNMTPAEILCALTYNGAGALASDASYGVLAPGYVAQPLFWNCATENYVEEILLAGILPVDKFAQRATPPERVTTRRRSARPK